MNKIINSGNSQDESHEAPNWKSSGACDVKTLHEKELEEKPSETGSGKSQGPGEKKGWCLPRIRQKASVTAARWFRGRERSDE